MKIIYLAYYHSNEEKEKINFEGNLYKGIRFVYKLHQSYYIIATHACFLNQRAIAIRHVNEGYPLPIVDKRNETEELILSISSTNYA